MDALVAPEAVVVVVSCDAGVLDGAGLVPGVALPGDGGWVALVAWIAWVAGLAAGRAGGFEQALFVLVVRGAAVGVGLAGFLAVGVPALRKACADGVAALAVAEGFFAGAPQGVELVGRLADALAGAVVLFVAG